MRAAKAVEVHQYRAKVAQYVDITALWELTKPDAPPNAMKAAINAAIKGKHVTRKDAEGLTQTSRETERASGVIDMPERVQLVCCDLLEIQAKLPIEPASVDAVLTDPL